MPRRPAPPHRRHQHGGVEAEVRPQTWPWWIAVASALGALALASGPGFEVDLQLFRVSAHDPRPLVVCTLGALGGAVAWRRRRAFSTDLPHLVADLRRHATRWAVAIALAACAVGTAWNSWTIGGSDSHCYAAQARAFASGALHVRQPLALEAPWPDATRTFAPVGFLPSETPGAFLPICAPGYPLLTAPLHLLDPRLQFLVAPLSAAVLVLATYVLTRRLTDEPLAALGSALLVASAPIMLFQATQPMTDAPAAAAFAAAAVLITRPRAATRAAGAALGICLVIRPNLLPAAVPFVAWCATGRAGARLAPFLLTLVPIAAVVPALNTAIYGAPWTTGYGDPAALFALAHIPTNLVRYSSWISETMTPLTALAIAAPWLVIPAARPSAMLLASLFVAVLACYLPYRPFDAWWYLRFLLPALPSLCALTTAGLFGLLGPSGRIGAAVALITTVVIAGWCLREARHREVFLVWRSEQRLAATAAYLTGRSLHPVAIAIQPNGAISYAGHPVVSWDSLHPLALEPAIAWLRRRGLSPVIVVDEPEEPLFRERFAPSSAYGRLDWPPSAVVFREVRVFDPDDRDRYWTGAATTTTWIDPPPARR